MSLVTVLLLILLFLLSVCSWIGDVYGWGLQSLYSAEGIRWIVANTLQNLRSAPLAEAVLAAACVGLTAESGFFEALVTLVRPHAPRLSLKQLRALQLSFLAAIVLMALLLWLTLFPPYVLLSAFGTLQDSALAAGLPVLLCVVCLCIGMAYGGLSGRFLSFGDLLHACGAWPTRWGGLFVAMLLAAELLSCVDYVVLPLAHHPLLRHGLHLAVYGLPILVQLWTQLRPPRRN